MIRIEPDCAIDIQRMIAAEYKYEMLGAVFLRRPLPPGNINHDVAME